MVRRLFPLAILVSLVAVLGVRALSADHDFEYPEQIDEAQHVRPKSPEAKEKDLAEKFARAHEKCSRDDWACQSACRRHFANSTGRCRLPHKNDNCFGVPIRYNYTVEEDGFDRFPQEYEVLRRFPKCWASLAPLICATQYRPCSIRSFYAVGIGMEEPSLIELWQVFRKDFCLTALSDCADVRALGFWPDFIDCEDKVGVPGRRGLFAEGNDCKMHYRELPSTTTPSQCLWPLVNSTSTDYTPVIDSCHMPCATALIYSGEQSGFGFWIACICPVLSVVFFLAFLYLSTVSKSYDDSFCTFAMSQCFLNASVYFGTIFVSWCFPASFTCTDDYRLRVDPSLGFGACRVQAFLLIMSFAQMELWYIAFCFLATCRKLRCRVEEIADQTYIRTGTFWLLFGTTFFVTFFLAQLAELDPGARLCFIGVHNFSYFVLVFYATLVAITLLATVFYVFALLKIQWEGEERAQRRDFNEVLLPAINGQSRAVMDPIDIPIRFLGVLVGLLFCCLIFGFAVQFTFSKPIDHEKNAILESMQCSLNETFAKYDASWANHASYWSGEADIAARSSLLHGRVTSSPNCAIKKSYFHPLVNIMYMVVCPAFPVAALFIFFAWGFLRKSLDVTDFRSPRDGCGDIMSCWDACFWRVQRQEPIQKSDEVEEGFLVEVQQPQENKRVPVEYSDSELPAPSVSRPFGSTEQLNYSVRMRDIVESGFETEPVTSNGDVNVKRKSHEAHERFENDREAEAKRQIIESSSDGEGAMTSVSQRQGNPAPMPEIPESDGTMPIGNLYGEDQVQEMMKTYHEQLTVMAQQNGALQSAILVQQGELQRVTAVASGQVDQIETLAQNLADATALLQQLEENKREEEMRMENTIPEEDEDIGEDEQYQGPRDLMTIMCQEEFEVESTIDGMACILNPFYLARYFAQHEDLFGTPMNLRILRHFRHAHPNDENDNLVRSESGYLWEMSADLAHFYFPDGNAYFSTLTEDDITAAFEPLMRRYGRMSESCKDSAERFKFCFDLLVTQEVIHRYDMQNPEAYNRQQYRDMLDADPNFNPEAPEDDRWNAENRTSNFRASFNLDRKNRSDEHLEDPLCSRTLESAEEQLHRALEEAQQRGERPITPSMFDMNFDEDDDDEDVNVAEQNEEDSEMEDLGLEQVPPNGEEALQPLPEGFVFELGDEDMMNEFYAESESEEEQDPNEGPELLPVLSDQPGTSRFLLKLEDHPDRLYGEGTAQSRDYTTRLKDFLASWEQIMKQIPKDKDLAKQNPDWSKEKREAWRKLCNPENLFHIAEDVRRQQQQYQGKVERFNFGENVRIGLERAGVSFLDSQAIESQFRELIANIIPEEAEEEVAEAEAEAAGEAPENEDVEAEDESEYEDEQSSDEGVESQSDTSEEVEAPQDPQQ